VVGRGGVAAWELEGKCKTVNVYMVWVSVSALPPPTLSSFLGLENRLPAPLQCWRCNPVCLVFCSVPVVNPLMCCLCRSRLCSSHLLFCLFQPIPYPITTP